MKSSLVEILFFAYVFFCIVGFAYGALTGDDNCILFFFGALSTFVYLLTISLFVKEK